MAAFAEDSAQDAGDGEDELAVRDFVADGGGDPVAGGVFGSRRGSHPSRGGQVARGARRGDDEAGRRKAQKVFIRTIIVRSKNGRSA